MADDESTTVASETEDNDVELEDIEVSQDELDSMEQSDDEEEEASEDEADDETTEDTSEDEESTEEEASDTEEESEPSEEDKQAEFKRQMFAKRQQEKAARVQSQKEQQQQYLEEAADAHDLALRQLQIDAYDNKVSRNNDVLKTSYEKAVKDLDILSNTDPVIQARIDKALDAFQAQHVTIDAYGNPTQVGGDLYAFLQSEAEDLEKLTGLRATVQKQSKDKQKSKTLSAPGRAPKEPKVDPDIAAFDEEAGL